MLESLENLLESAGHAVCLFTSAQAFLNDEAFAKVDCIISDIGMPAIDGFELERLARAARPELPVILITGCEEFIKGPQAHRVGAEILLKPVGEQELLRAINKARRLDDSARPGHVALGQRQNRLGAALLRAAASLLIAVSINAGRHLVGFSTSGNARPRPSQKESVLRAGLHLCQMTKTSGKTLP